MSAAPGGDGWEPRRASQVAAGDRLRVGSMEVTVSRIQERFLDRDGMIAFIEDSPERWLKVPVPVDADVEVEVDH
ncbi:MAG: hypothetical protein ACRDYZ_15875 [Acidimicrobiales bacterium]